MKEKKMRAGRVLALAGVLGFQGCMRHSLEVGRNPAQAGKSGNAGEGAATSGGFGGGQGGSGLAGGRASGGSPAVGGGAGADGGAGGTSAGAAGTSAGAAGTSAGAGGTSAGAAGTGAGAAGTGETPGGNGGGAGAPPFTFDPACDCHAAADGEFDCTMSTSEAQQRVTVPLDCENDLDYVRRSTCSGPLKFEWSEGMENHYDLQLSTGSLIYMRAIGYVGALCGIEDSSYDHGTITAGEDPYATCSPPTCVSECGPQCFVCEGTGSNGDTSLAACETCSDPLQVWLNTEPLEDFCNFHDCPTSVAEAEAELSACTFSDLVVTTGCGTISVEHGVGAGDTAYYFDAESGALTGATTASDTPFGNCQTVRYDGGTVPAPSSCTEQTSCSLCPGSSALPQCPPSGS